MKEQTYRIERDGEIYELSWFSRQGYIIPPSKADLQSLSEKYLDKTLLDHPGFEEIVLDGELMPWSTLGEGLVEQYQAFINLSRKVSSYGLPSEGLDEMQKQLDIFGVQEEPSFIPFSILKLVKQGKCSYPEYEWHFADIEAALNNNVPNHTLMCIEEVDCKFVRELDNILNGGITEGESYQPLFDYLLNGSSNGLMEGVVIKPLLAEDRLKIPYIKVRNREYLRLVYGPNYLSEPNYSSHVSNKDIRGKLYISTKEYALGKKMLMGEQRSAMVEMLGQIERESNLDPRL